MWQGLALPKIHVYDDEILAGLFGIGGGVSLAALQLAKAAGARVIVTSRDAATLNADTIFTFVQSVIDVQRSHPGPAAFSYARSAGALLGNCRRSV